jgi:hypothetical protein
MKRVAVISVAPLVAVTLLVGCSTSSTTKPPQASTTTITRVPPSNTTTQPVGTPTPTTTPVALASHQCTANALKPSWPGTGNGASQHLFYVINVMNSSSATCVTGGYVGVSAYDPAGNLLAASETRQASLGSPGTPTLSVAPGTSVHFTVGLADSNISAGGTECSTRVGAFHLIPPNETTEVQVATPISSGYPTLCGNEILVGPLQSGAVTT